MLMDAPNKEFAPAGSLEELKAKGRLVVHGGHRPILVIYDRGRVFALDNRCPHMGFPLERGSVEDGILTCHWHHARFDLESGCTFDLWADDVPDVSALERARREADITRQFAAIVEVTMEYLANQHRGKLRTDRLELMEILDFLGVDMRRCFILNNRVALRFKSGDHLNHELQTLQFTLDL